MANSAHLEIFKQGTNAWNIWRAQHPKVLPDLSFANLRGANCVRANLAHVYFRGADLTHAHLRRADLREADLRGAQLRKADLTLADLREANLSEANLQQADLRETDLSQANLSKANLSEVDARCVQLRGAKLVSALLNGADLREAQLSFIDLNFADCSQANLWKADLSFADLSFANLSFSNLSLTNLSSAKCTVTDLSSANLNFANLSKALLIEANLTDAKLTGCSVSGSVLWQVKLAGTEQKNLVILTESAAVITIDNLNIAHFLSLLLDNRDLRAFIGTITPKAALILGSFTPERKDILDALRDALRQQDYIPILFNAEQVPNHAMLETLKTLAQLARFIFVDITELEEIRPQLEAIVPLVKISIQPLRQSEKAADSGFGDFQQYPWVQPVYLYKDQATLSSTLEKNILLLAERTPRIYEKQGV